MQRESQPSRIVDALFLVLFVLRLVRAPEGALPLGLRLCDLGDASGCGDCSSGGLFLAGPARHRHEAEDQGPPDEGGQRAARSVSTRNAESLT